MKKVITLSSKGQITLPKKARLAIGLELGKEVSVQVQDDAIVIKRVPHFTDFAGALEGAFEGDPVEIIRKQRDTEWNDYDDII